MTDVYDGLDEGEAGGRFEERRKRRKRRGGDSSSSVAAPSINLSSSTVSDTASVGDLIGTLSVLNGTGIYTFSLTSNPGNLFLISGTSLEVAASLTAGSDAITIQADNGAGSVVTQPFLITVTHAGTVFLKADLSDANANEAWVFW